MNSALATGPNVPKLPAWPACCTPPAKIPKAVPWRPAERNGLLSSMLDSPFGETTTAPEYNVSNGLLFIRFIAVAPVVMLPSLPITGAKDVAKPTDPTVDRALETYKVRLGSPLSRALLRLPEVPQTPAKPAYTLVFDAQLLPNACTSAAFTLTMLILFGASAPAAVPRKSSAVCPSFT